MTIREEHMNLFDVPQGYYLAHCISADFALGAGIAKQFDEIYDMRFKLNMFFPIDPDAKYDEYNIGTALLVDNVFNLVTKPRGYHKPRYKDLYTALEDMEEQCASLYIKKLAMPLIGCGLDGLDWNRVKDMIEEIFKDTDIDILVCVL